ncbi:MAG: T9SS type A sorting domain-containing protein [Clostridia bacterium]|nr:T9SS type A sorting domain-containing protein [Clostridia bacterium]
MNKTLHPIRYLTFGLTAILTLIILPASSQAFRTGADLSFVNAMEDCGAIYYENGVAKDPFVIFGERGAGIARFRLWHTPAGIYNSLADVKVSIARAKATGMQVLLDFHYSDTWADPGAQLRPLAWQQIDDLQVLADSLYNYTYNILYQLHLQDLLPELVQLGNEINGNILLKPDEPLYPNNWPRNVLLLQRAQQAVTDINALAAASIKTVIHIAQPENALWWFADASANGLDDFDIIGFSYYPGWSVMSVREAAAAVAALRQTYGKEVMIVETAYPFTLSWADNTNNLLGADNLLPSYGNQPSPENQRDFLTELSWLVKESGGSAVIYWEPAWVSTACGSSWENAAFFDFDHELREGIGFMDYDYEIKPTALDDMPVTFMVDMTGVDTSQGVFVTGDFTGLPWQLVPMQSASGNIFSYQTTIPGRSRGAYIFRNNNNWLDASRETVPAECALYWGNHRRYVMADTAALLAFVWSSCNAIGGTAVAEWQLPTVRVFPNPASDAIWLQGREMISSIVVYDAFGKLLKSNSFFPSQSVKMDIADFPSGVYFLKIITKDSKVITQKFLKYEK